MRVVDVPRPTIGPTEVLVRTTVSVISAGTERAVTRLAQSSLLAKARARPDLVRQVLAKARTEGIGRAARAVQARLDDDIPLGYSAAGVVVEVGEMVTGISPQELVATGGAGKANHADFQAVPGLLCAVVPDGVGPGDAAFATVGSIALHGCRLADVEAGAKVVVIGLGLMGQLAVRLAQAAGCDVAAVDVSEAAVARARAAGALGLLESGAATTESVLDWSRGRGADAVLVAAATRSSDVVLRAPALCRDRATVVVLGDVGLDLDRRPLYEKELSLRFARSYGPGRYEPSYEAWGVDLPAGLVRWTEGRNLEAVLDLLASGRLVVDDLVTHRFEVGQAAGAYQLIEEAAEPFCAVQLTYPGTAAPDDPIRLKPPARGASPAAGLGVGLIGAGAFARAVLLPAVKDAGFGRLVAVASASGLSARQVAEKAGFEKAVSGAEAVIGDPEVGVVVIATPHASHARLAAAALRAGKHVFCEKPLALDEDELADVADAWRESGTVLFVGFNRRWSAPVGMVADHFRGRQGPLVVTYRVNAGRLPDTHWYHDRTQGGRLLGEVCHFVDTCAAIVGHDAVDVTALGTGVGERLLAEDLVVSLAYPDGSVAAITYASGGPADVDKERIEVLGRGRSATLADFRAVALDGVDTRFRVQDKGHTRQLVEFRRAVLGGGSHVTEAMLGSTRSTLAAAAGLGRRRPAPAPG